MPHRRPSCVVALALFALPAIAAAQPYGIDAPTAIGTYLNGAFPAEAPVDPSASDWTIVSAYPNLSFDSALVITPPAENTPISHPVQDRLFVAQRDGKIYSFEPADPQVTDKHLLVDLTDRVAVVWDGGFLGMVFHPEFGQPASAHSDEIFVYYSSYCGAKEGENGLRNDPTACTPDYPRGSTNGYFDTYLRLSRLRVDASSDPPTVDASTEEILVNIHLYNGSHRGGGLLFADDGYLYVTIGEQFHYETAQDLASNFEGGILRLDVDVSDDGNGDVTCNSSSSHLPIRTMPSNAGSSDEFTGRRYCIPDDNPFLAPGGETFEEFATLGNRAPHRMTKDRVTGRIWSAEIGASEREEVNIIELGRNYGWPFREGLGHGPRADPPSYIGVLTDPVVDFVRSDARAVIGGYVYRGAAFPELEGRYLVGDYIQKNVWALTYDAVDGAASIDLLAQFPGDLITWGEDAAGEPLMGRWGDDHPLYTLARTGPAPPDPPALLSQTGAFTDLASLTPAPGLMAFEPQNELWVDGAIKRGWVAIPNDGTHDTPAERVDFSETGNWGFPLGTVIVKHFELPTDEGNPALRRRLETRFFVHGTDGWYGITYRWLPDESDAELLPGRATDLIEVETGSGTEQHQWDYPSRGDCLLCHTEKSGRVLGLRTHRLNGDLTYPASGVTDNQLRTWNHLGIFSPALDEAAIAGMPRAVALDDPTSSLEDRSRAYLDANCAGCHRPQTSQLATRNRAVFDARFTTPLGSQELLDGVVNDDLGIAGARVIVPGDLERSILFRRLASVTSTAMPPLGRRLADREAVDILAAWILSAPPQAPGNSAPVLELPSAFVDRASEAVQESLDATDDDGDALWFTVSGLPPGLSVDARTGVVSGTVPADAYGDYVVTVGVSDGPTVHSGQLTWTVLEPVQACNSSGGGGLAAAPALFALAMVRTRRERRDRVTGRF